MLIYIMKMILLMMFGFGAGALSASGLFAIITSVGLLNRFAKVSKTTDNMFFYENMVILGVTSGNILFIFDLHLTLGIVVTAIFGLISGIFVGCFAICLAETIKALPIFIRRVRIANGLGYIILAIALGKGVGNLLYQFFLYK